VSSDGFMMTVQPASRACGSLNAASASGAFHGTMAATTPTGRFSMRALTPDRPVRSSVSSVTSAREA
jgi:hypothetical protein